jgi:hypothetical protein
MKKSTGKTNNFVVGLGASYGKLLKRYIKKPPKMAFGGWKGLAFM